MKIRIDSAGSAEVWTPTGNAQEVQILRTILIGSTSITVPATLTLRGETSRKGVRRVVVRSELKLPGTVLAGLANEFTVLDPKVDQVISAHVVLQMPQILAQNGIADNTRGGALTALMRELASVIAVVTDVAVLNGAADVNGGSDLDQNRGEGPALIAQALAGMAPLDPISGERGVAYKSGVESDDSGQ